MTDPFDLEPLRKRRQERRSRWPTTAHEVRRYLEAEGDLDRAIQIAEEREDVVHAAKSSIASFMREVERLTAQLADADCDLDQARQAVLLLRDVLADWAERRRFAHRIFEATDHYEQHRQTQGGEARAT